VNDCDCDYDYDYDCDCDCECECECECECVVMPVSNLWMMPVGKRRVRVVRVVRRVAEVN